jgi:hypothetical protein
MRHTGGRKRSYYAYDLWNIKYLPKFKWHHLTERIGMHRPGPDRVHACTSWQEGLGGGKVRL